MKRLAVTFIGLVLSTVAVASDIYFTATGEQHGQPLIFRALRTVPEGVSKAELPYRITISWRYEPVARGMPSAETNGDQIAFEDAVMALDVNSVGRQMLVVTGNGRKVWYWYVRDADAWQIQLAQKIAGNSYPIKLERAYDGDWSLYEDFIANVRGCGETIETADGAPAVHHDHSPGPVSATQSRATCQTQHLTEEDRVEDDILSGRVRPEKIPSNWVGRPTSSAPGWRWDDPNDPGNSVRFFAGDAHDPVQSKRAPYVVVVSGGLVIGADGKPVPDSNIPE